MLPWRESSLFTVLSFIRSMASSMASKLRGNVSLSEIDVLLLVREGELLATGDTTTELLSTCEKLDRDRDRELEDLRLLCRGSDGEPETPGVFGASIGVIDISVRGVDRALRVLRKLELQVL